MSIKVDTMVDDFSWGLNTRDPAHQLDPRELQVAEWVEGKDRSLTKAKGKTKLVASSIGSGGIKGLHVHVNSSGTELVHVVHGGKLLRLYSGAWTDFGVKTFLPRGLTATVATSGAVGPHLAASTTYHYFIYGEVLAANGSGYYITSRVSAATGGTPYPITISAGASYKVNNYKVLRATNYVGPYYLMATVSHTEVDMGGGRIETRFSWTDDGNTAPPALHEYFEYPGSINNTTITLPDSPATFVSDGDSFYFANGMGIVQYDPIYGPMFVSPADYDSTYGQNDMHSFNSNFYTVKGVSRHQSYAFAWGFNTTTSSRPPIELHYSRLGRWDYWPSLGVITAQTNAKILSACTLYNTLAVATERGVETLHGKTFTPDSDNFDGYWSVISAVGVASGKTWVRVPANGRDLIVGATNDKDIRAIYADTAVESYMNSRSLAEHIKPTLELLTDWANAAAVYHNGRYIISFPADKKILVGYPDRRADGAFAWYGPYSMNVGLSCFAVRKDGTLIAGDADNGFVYVMDSGYALSDGSAYTMRARTADFDFTLKTKKIKRLYVTGKQQTSTSTCTARVFAGAEYKESTGIDLNTSGTTGVMVIGEDSLGDEDAPIVRTSLRIKGRRISYEVENAVAGEPVTVYGFREIYSVKKPK